MKLSNSVRILYKALIFIGSLALAWWLIKSGYLHILADKLSPFRFFSALLAGAFYTSFLTAPVSVAMLIVVADSANPILIGILAGAGAVMGDLLIVKLFRDRFRKDKDVIALSHELQLARINQFLRRWNLEFIVPIVGAVIVASPLPDELGLILLGNSRLKYSELIVLTYILNTAGIMLIVLPANLLQ